MEHIREVIKKRIEVYARMNASQEEYERRKKIMEKGIESAKKNQGRVFRRRVNKETN